MAESTLGRAYRVLYEALCGRHPNPMPWHWQWLPSRLLNRDFKVQLPKLKGSVLDIGCGQKPYLPLLGSVSEYVGADVVPSPHVDVLITPNQSLPLPDGRFDAVMINQVFEFVEKPAELVSEIRRVLKPGGVVVASFPFIFQEHGSFDLVRYTGNAVRSLFAGFMPVEVKRQGGIGSTLAILFLNWINQSLNLNMPLRLLRPLLLPVWLPLCLVVNLLALVVDFCDRTASYYTNVIAVLKKNPDATTQATEAGP
jgi:SAM-dependent methyltransferase